ncbi:MAG: AmmeMemoRadiSam system protein B [Anaerolineae bacterium]
MKRVRSPAVAGTFYPSQAGELKKQITAFLNAAPGNGADTRAIIAPHAGYIYSGPVAACAYRYLADSHAAETVRRVVLLGPAHYVPVAGLALSSAAAFATPLGSVPLDAPTAEKLLALPHVSALEAAHRREHSLEVHLPFFQSVLGSFSLVPLVVGDAAPAEVAEVLEQVWNPPQTLIVVSSDLSHFHDYNTARQLDQATARAIEALQPGSIDREQACGRIPVQGLLLLARKLKLKAKTVDLRNSGDTAGPRDRVVGYGAWVFVQSTPPPTPN